MSTQIAVRSKPTVRSPFVVAGLPGVGSVAWLAANHLVKELGAELFAEVYCPAFSPKVWLTDDGIVQVMKGEFHFWHNKTGEKDLVVFSANEQPYSPEGQYELAEKVLDFIRNMAPTRLITMGGSVTERDVEDPKLYGGATEPILMKELEEEGVLKLAGGSITGTNGLLCGLAKVRDIPAVCLLAETPGYITFDANAAMAIIKALNKIIGLEVDTSVLKKQVQQNQEALKKAKEMSRYVGQEEQKKGGRQRELYM